MMSGSHDVIGHSDFVIQSFLLVLVVSRVARAPALPGSLTTGPP